MSEIYPPEDLEWDNNNTGNPLREPILSLAELEDDECGELYDAIEELGLDDMQPVAALIGLAPEPGTLWSDMRVGELKTLLALAIEDEEAALEGCDWIRHFEQLDSERRRVYRCIEVLLGMDDTSRYSKGIVGLFGRETVAKAEALINGTMRFWDVPSPTLALKGCEMHQSLLEAYGKIHPQLANLNN
jgi:ribosomal protein S12 methylthiotransferase accessory factor